jgi:amidase
MTDAAIVLSVIAGKDPDDNFTLTQPDPVPNYMKALKKDALKGKRIGVPRQIFLNNSISGVDLSVNVQFEKALDIIRGLGATVVDPANMPSAAEIIRSKNETVVANVDFKVSARALFEPLSLFSFLLKVQLNQWFTSLLENPSGVRSLSDLIKFNDDHPKLEEPPQFEDQSQFVLATAMQQPSNTNIFAQADCC